jgi:2-polyprenyl-6-methoxyphenol hydroxylase-like FAD-dependent oxidoreductase
MKARKSQWHQPSLRLIRLPVSTTPNHLLCMANKPVTIIGGGLAGLTLGIGLRQRGIPAIVWEAGRYPRHRACGEFISGRGREVLERLGLLDSLTKAGMREGSTAMFLTGTKKGPMHAIDPPALCLSRYAMDNLLARHFQSAGGELREGQRWEGRFSDGVVRAGGRRAQPHQGGWIWFGLKVHARNVSLEADLELHCRQNGYIGLCRLPAGETNICGLFRRRVSSQAHSQNWRDFLRGDREPLLYERLRGAVFDETSFCAVAGLRLLPQRASSLAECCIGDALTMIPPVTGNGMSMAFEAAELAIDPLTDYSRGAVTWGEAQQAIAQACDGRFAQRLTWARRLQQLMFIPGMCGILASVALRSEWLWGAFYTRTR